MILFALNPVNKFWFSRVYYINIIIYLFSRRCADVSLSNEGLV